MYNLLVSGNREAWNGEPYVLERNRVLEHTADQVREQFAGLNEQQLSQLYSLPSIFAYEEPVGQNARVGRIERVRHRDREVRIEYSFAEHIPQISPETLKQLMWELDIGEGELYRTHWAVKDVDVTEELLSAHVITEEQINSLPASDAVLLRRLPRPDPIPVQPTIFRVPQGEVEADLVSVMMPFQAAFSGVFETIQRACVALNLRCMSANQIWDESEIIQDIFSLIYRSRVVVCDFSDQNPNVFYEAGVAHTLGRPVVPLVQNIKDIPFDLRHHRHIQYLNNGEGLAALMEQLTPRLQTLMAQRG